MAFLLYAYSETFKIWRAANVGWRALQAKHFGTWRRGRQVPIAQNNALVLLAQWVGIGFMRVAVDKYAGVCVAEALKRGLRIYICVNRAGVF